MAKAKPLRSADLLVADGARVSRHRRFGRDGCGHKVDGPRARWGSPRRSALDSQEDHEDVCEVPIQANPERGVKA